MVAVILSGGLLAATYIFPVVSRGFFSEAAPRDIHKVPRVMEYTSLALAIIAVALGLFARQPLELLEIGSPFSTAAIKEMAP